MLKYIFISLLLTVLSYSVYGQDCETCQSANKQDTTQIPVKDRVKTPYPNKKKGTEIGIDVSRFLVPIFDEYRFELEANIRTNIGKRTFFAGAAGTESVSFDIDEYSYDSQGFFVKGGIDYDIFAVNEETSSDYVLFGFRYGMALQTHEADRVTVEDGYWGDYSTSRSSTTLSTYWLEMIAGLRTEVLNNFYMSWFISLKGKVAMANPGDLGPYSVPGYGNGDNVVNVGFEYILGYQIPWGNKKHKERKIKRELSKQ